jgi:3,4-dihydroxy 2-butanone 4-phosphate synthase/GTP cyclohydrolase II
MRHDLMNQLSLVATHRISMREGNFELQGFSLEKYAREIIVLYPASGWSRERPLVRVQLSCLYGEVFHSRDCDCGQQLDASLRLIHRRRGVMIYFPDTDARGLGLIAKLRLSGVEQTTGCSSYGAAKKLEMDYSNFECFDAVPLIFQKMGIAGPIQLVSNSPQKLEAITAHGIAVSSVVNLRVDPTKLSDAGRRELDEKRERFQHVVLMKNHKKTHVQNDKRSRKVAS